MRRAYVARMPCATYQPRDAERGVLHRIVEVNLDAFLNAAAHHAEGARLRLFVEQEFRDFLTCGVLTHGFARLRCGECAFERLVPFSCKGRGFCPSCGGRRMTESAACLVDHVLPHVPIRCIKRQGDSGNPWAVVRSVSGEVRLGSTAEKGGYVKRAFVPPMLPPDRTIIAA